MKVSNMVNIGPKTEAMLKEIGITTNHQVMAYGALEVASMLQMHFPDSNINPLIFAGAVKGIRWRSIDPFEQETIIRQFSELSSLVYCITDN